jgi:hypothetical protein
MKVFYLKSLAPKLTRENGELFELIPDDDKSLDGGSKMGDPIYQSIDLRQEAGLKKCFEYIKSRSGKASFYFISLGHGIGYGLKPTFWLIDKFPDGFLDRARLPEIFKDLEKSDFDNRRMRKEYQEILEEAMDITWNIELRNSLKVFNGQLLLMMI